MEVNEISITAIKFSDIKPEDVFVWLEEFAFKRYGVRYYIDPSKRDDPRYPAERDKSSIDWYTHLAIPSQHYNRTMIIIDEELFNKIKQAFSKSIKKS